MSPRPAGRDGRSPRGRDALPGRDLAAAGAVLALALAYRLWLSGVYAGWEESDYGNLAMAWEAWRTGLRSVRMEFMPLYYLVSGMAAGAFGDARPGTLFVSMAGGMAALAASMAVAARLFDRRVALVAGLFLVFQPEFALYSSTSLREPFFAGLLWCGIAALVHGRALLAAGLVSGSFLVRFDSLFSNMPAVAVHMLRQGRGRLRAAWRPAALMAGTVLAWSAYCRVRFGTFLFFSSPVSANLGNGGIAGIEEPLDAVRNGAAVVFALLTYTVPKRVGWVFVVAALAGVVLVLRERRARWPASSLLVFFALDLGFWLGLGLIGQHDPDHNLYWKWFMPVVPHFAILGAFGLVAAADRWLPERPPVRVAAWGAVAVATALVFARETEFQVQRSLDWYRPQRDLARWVEDHAPPGSVLLMDGIPWGWIGRRDHPFRFISWADTDLPAWDREALGSYIDHRSVDYVLWFREDWARPTNACAFLERAVTHRVGQYALIPLRDESDYGFVFYRVDPLSRHPSVADLPPGWPYGASPGAPADPDPPPPEDARGTPPPR